MRTIRLMEIKTSGRAFQHAAIAAALTQLGGTQLEKKLTAGAAKGQLELTEEELKALGAAVADALRLAQGARGGTFPSLYTGGRSKHGGPGDSGIFRGLGILGEERGRYMQDLIEYSAQLGSKEVKEDNMPLLFKAYLFTTTRDRLAAGRGGRGRRRGNGEEEAGTVDSLSAWLGLAGAAISLVGVLAGREGRQEVFILPDGSPQSLEVASKFYSLLYNITKGPTLWEALRSFSEAAVSADLALWLSVMVHLSQAEDVATKPAGRYESLIAVRIATGNRPQVAWASPLPLSRYMDSLTRRRALSVVKQLHGLTRWLRRQGTEEYNAASAALTACVHGLFRFLEARDVDALTACGLEASRAVEKLGDDARDLLRGLAALA